MLEIGCYQWLRAVFPECDNFMNGNMARALFKIPELLADISGQKECKKGAAKFLIAILALQQIDWVKLKKYCNRTIALFL